MILNMNFSIFLSYYLTFARGKNVLYYINILVNL